MTRKKSLNPLYVVTNKGQDVEVLTKGFKGILQYWSLERVVNLTKFIWDFLLKNLQGMTLLLTIEKILQQWVEQLKVLAENGVSTVKMLLQGMSAAKGRIKD